MAQAPIYLTILRKGDINIVDLAEVGSLIPRSEARVEDTFLQELVAEVTSLATPGYGRGESGAVVQALQRMGGVLFSQLLTEPARQRLRAAESCDLYLRLDEQLVQVPWELCYDGEQFLATKFRMGRQVITSYPIPPTMTARKEHGPLRVLLIADPTETLPQAGEEAERLCELLGSMSGVEVTLLGGHDVRQVPLLAALQAHEVVHFAGHSHYDPQTFSQSGWLLHEGIVTAREVGTLNLSPLLVFSNSCQAGATIAWGENSRYDQQAFGIGSAFLLAGVKNYIGTFWVVHDEESLFFATTFYRGVVAGLSLGEALHKARHEAIRHRGWQGLTWASYMLYGDPAFTLLPTPVADPLKLPQEAQLGEWNDDLAPREMVRRHERGQCASLDLLGKPVSFDTHYQVLPLLREVKRERLPRTKRSQHHTGKLEEEPEETEDGLQGVDLLRWEEGLQDESVTYEPVSLLEVFKEFRSVVKEATSTIPRFVVLGPPGSGKTTLVQYLGWQAANEHLQISGSSLLPVRVRLREWEAWATNEKSPDPSLAVYLAMHCCG
jgi:hypothetical protein